MLFKKAGIAQGNAGFSILEGLVGAVVGGAVIYGVSAGMLSSMRVAKSVESKTDANNFQQLVALSLSSSENAMKMLQVDGAMTSAKLPSSFSSLPEGGVRCDESPGATQNRCPQVEFSKLKLVDGLVYQSNSPVGQNLKFNSAKLIIVNMTSEKVPATHASLKQRREYYAKLQYSLVRGTAQQGGVEAYNKFYPMLVEIEKVDGSTLKLASAYGVGENNEASESCKKMGGKWLKNSESATFFPNERCHFGGQVEVEKAEWPDLLDPNGAVMDNIRPIECLNSLNGALRVFKCPGRMANSTRKSWACRFRRTGNQGDWRYSYITGFSNGSPVFSTTYDYNCDLGLIASSSKSMELMLRFDEPLVEAWNENAKTFTATADSTEEYLAESDRLHAVQSCRKQWDLEVWTPCLNSSKPELARAGGVGSCIFVRNGKVSSIAGLGIDVTGVSSANNIANYTGWMLVTTARTFGMLNSDGGKFPTITEAIGVPCYQVSVASGSYTGAEFGEPEFSAVNQAKFNKAAQCIVKLPITKNTAPTGVTHRLTTLSCSKNAGLEGDPLSWTEIQSDGSRLEDALSALQITPSTGSFGVRLRSSTATALASSSLNATTEFDGVDLVKVVMQDLNDDGEDEDCIYKRSAVNWGASVAVGQVRATIKGAIDSTVSIAANACLTSGEFSAAGFGCFKLGTVEYGRRTDAGALMPNLACTRPGALEAVPAEELVALRDLINAKLAIENAADSEFLTTDTCAFFSDVRITNRANSLPDDGAPKVADFNTTYVLPSSGACTDATCFSKVTLPTSYNDLSSYPAPALVAPGSNSFTQAQLNGTFTGWAWLRAGIPKTRFRTDDDRNIVWDATSSTYKTNDPFSGNVIFRQIELNNAGKSGWLPFPTPGKVAGRHYFVPLGHFDSSKVKPGNLSDSTRQSKRRAITAVNGEICNQGVRFRTP